MAAPRVLPPGFLQWARWRVGLLAARPRKGVPPASDFARQWPWAFDQLAQFGLWNAWRSAAGSFPRPQVWARVPEWAWTLRGEWLRARRPPTPPVIRPGFFDRPGMLTGWGFRLGDPRLHPETLAPVLVRHGFKWVSVNTDETPIEMRDGIFDVLAQHGLGVAIWMQNRLGPNGYDAAQVVNRDVVLWRPDAVQVCIEIPDFDSLAFLANVDTGGRPGQVITNLDFQRHEDGTPVSGAAWPWEQHGWTVAPEAYLGSNPHADPVEMEFAARQVGWTRVQPLIELSETARAGLYLPGLRLYPGWAAYLHEQTTDADLAALAR